jgi:GH15 family glucan-1,4-alpha-glucosidase
MDAVAQRWQEPDAGIWEQRHRVRHHVHSKVLMWVAADRAIRLGQRWGRPLDGGWFELRDRIACEVLERGWNPTVAAFTVAYGSDKADAAALWVLLSGLVPAVDERAVSTVRFVEHRLRRGPTVFRYRLDDGLAGHDEGGFHICTAWLAESLWRIGRHDDAVALFEDLLACSGPTGLLSEMYDPDAMRALGNTPQAYSHAGVIRTALVLQGRWDEVQAP